MGSAVRVSRSLSHCRCTFASSHVCHVCRGLFRLVHCKPEVMRRGTPSTCAPTKYDKVDGGRVAILCEAIAREVADDAEIMRAIAQRAVNAALHAARAALGLAQRAAGRRRHRGAAGRVRRWPGRGRRMSTWERAARRHSQPQRCSAPSSVATSGSRVDAALAEAFRPGDRVVAVPSAGLLHIPAAEQAKTEAARAAFARGLDRRQVPPSWAGVATGPDRNRDPRQRNPHDPPSARVGSSSPPADAGNAEGQRAGVLFVNVTMGRRTCMVQAQQRLESTNARSRLPRAPACRAWASPGSPPRTRAPWPSPTGH